MLQTKTKTRKTVKTAFGPVDPKALEDLQNHFDTTLLPAAAAIDQARYRDEPLIDDEWDAEEFEA